MSIKKPQRFSSLGFIFSTIGAAVGLGNIWRFPKVMATNGGTSFIFIYLIVLFFLVLPVIFLEIQYGVFFKSNPINSFSKATKKKSFRIFGWFQIACIFLLCLYYAAVTGWVLTSLANYVVPNDFSSIASGYDLEGNSGFLDSSRLTGNGVIESLPGQWNLPTFVKGFYLWIWAAIAAIIILIVLVLGFGRTKVLGKVNLIIVPGLFFLLIGLLVYVLTLQHSKDAINFLFKFDETAFSNLENWKAALEQAIFSTGILFGIFIVFSASADVRIDKANDAIIVVAADTLAGIMAAVIVTCAIAANSTINSDTGGTEEGLKKFFGIDAGETDTYENVRAGPGLVFTVMPLLFYSSIGNNQTSGTQFYIGYGLNLFFFISLFFAAFSSLIALVSSFTTTIQEQLRISNGVSLLFISSFIFLASFVFCVGEWTNSTESTSEKLGPKLIDSQDKYVLYTVMLIGIFQIFFFAASSQLKSVLKYSEKYSYLKLSRFSILRIILLFLVVPAFVYMTAVGSLDVYNSLVANDQKTLEVSPFFNVTKSSGKEGNLPLVNWISLGMFGGAMLFAFLGFLRDYFSPAPSLNNDRTKSLKLKTNSRTKKTATKSRKKTAIKRTKRRSTSSLAKK